ncbi:response regulator transcription factor [Ectobacillus sp. JY-23]|uniref:response regulator transcription factor n=1 Tax=Ectobacillus sp. JY-23 TaxID=2933872 RepID=UPI001FF272C8|nr:response regulator transcription factor [Ectobacillus sp. JY-23]UOY91528.1 response regulator transcription factor [Ectobacillus sp. JY-23]
MGEIRILVAEDDKEICDLVRRYLEREMYQVDTVTNGEEALRLFQEHTYNLVMLDVMMPKLDGMEVCRQIRAHSNVPIMMLTAKDHETDKVLGLGVGADDYITKPFSINEVIARVKALMRRFLVLGGEGRLADESLQCGEITIDLKTYQVTVRKESVSLTAKEFELLKFFMSQPERVFTKVQLFRQVWGSGYIEDDNTVMVHIRKLRKKIELDPSHPQYIQTVWGIGYKFTGGNNEDR